MIMGSFMRRKIALMIGYTDIIIRQVSKMNSRVDGNTVIAELSGKIDSTNAPQLEQELEEILRTHEESVLALDADSLEYISSAGLRVLMKIRKNQGGLTVINVSRDVYDIFDVTGFVDILDVKRKLRQISVEGCELLGKGGNGEVYRIDPETILKVYNEGAALEKIALEKQYATATFKEGLPCAIAYDTVKVGTRFGIVFELLNAVTVGKAVNETPDRIPEIGEMMGKLLRQLHGTEMRDGVLPKISDKMFGWIDYIEEKYLSHEDAELLREVVRAVPEKNTLLHLDFHEGNVMLQDGELILIDLDDVCVGNPVYDLCAYYIGHILASQSAPDAVEKSLGMNIENVAKIYTETMRSYLGTEDEAVLSAHNQQMQLFSLFWMIVYLGKGKDSSNLTHERANGVIQMVLPQFKQVAPMIIQMVQGWK